MAGITRTTEIPVAEPQEHSPPRSSGLGGLWSVSGTFLTSFMLFGWFAVQGIVLARMLGPEGRGGFAATIAYPQMLLYLGLLGAADLFARRAARWQGNDAPLRRAALRYGSLTGTLTMLASGLLILIAGSLIAVATALVYLWPRTRSVEADLPDVGLIDA